jgi:hypothetical protein
MKPEEQEIAIAETFPSLFEIERSERDVQIFWHSSLTSRFGDRRRVHLYIDLNAIHEVEKKLVGWIGRDGIEFPVDAYQTYTENLIKGGGRGAFSSSAAQRCGALLRTLGKWED